MAKSFEPVTRRRSVHVRAGPPVSVTVIVTVAVTAAETTRRVLAVGVNALKSYVALLESEVSVSMWVAVAIAAAYSVER
jgi:hypothetical protein